jgi:membrane AbrB-like protein
MSRAAAWLALGAATVVVAVALDAVGLPSSTLFGALLLGLLVALRSPGRFELRGPGVTAAHATTGVVLGAYLQSSSLQSLADAWLPVLLVSSATLLLSLVAGALMARFTDVDEPTAALGMVAGGASGIIAMASELGADDRVVAFMQYVRVLAIVMATPLLVALLFGDHHAAAGAVADGGAFLGTAPDWAITAAVAAAGAVLGRVARLPAATLMGPLLLAAALTLALPPDSFTVPPLLREAAFAVIGLQVGLRFTAATFRQLARLVAPLLISVVALSVICFGFAVLLEMTTRASLLDAYLATTPGGLYAVLAAAVGTGADTTFVVGVQSIRLVVMVLVAPFAVRAMLRLQSRRRVPAR